MVHIDLDMEGTIPPEDDPPQAMGDPSIEVTEDMRDKAQEERTQGSMAMAEGSRDFFFVCLESRTGLTSTLILMVLIFETSKRVV